MFFSKGFTLFIKDLRHPIRAFDRTFSDKAWMQFVWLLIGVTFLCVICYLLSFPFNFMDKDESGLCLGRLGKIIMLLIDPGQTNTILYDNTRIFAVIISLFGQVLIIGVTISVISNMLIRRVELYRNGKIYYKLSNHITILGFDKMTLSLVKQICADEKYNDYDILIMSSDNIPLVREQVFSVIDKDDVRRFFFFRGRNNSDEDLSRLNFRKVKEIFIIGDTHEINRDAANMEAFRKVVFFIRSLIEQKKIKMKVGERTPVMVLLEHQTTFTAFQTVDLSLPMKVSSPFEEKKKINVVDFRPFSYYENWAKKLIYTREYNDVGSTGISKVIYPSLDRGGITADSEKYVHLVIFSMSRMGVALGTLAAQVCHFPNFVTKKIKTKITFIDENADIEMQYFMGRYSHFFEISEAIFENYIDDSQPEMPKILYEQWKDMLDIQFHFIKGSAEKQSIRNLIEEWANDKRQILSIAVCRRESSENMAIGFYLPDSVYENEIPVFIRQKSSGALLTMLNSNENSYKYKQIYPFGMQDDCYELDYKEYDIARLFNYFYSGKGKNEIDYNEIKESWLNLPIAHQWSNLYLTYSVPFKLNSLKPLDNDPAKIDYESFSQFLSYKKSEDGQITVPPELQLVAQVEHNRWNVEKLLLGFRALRPDEDEVLLEIDRGVKNGTRKKEDLKDKRNYYKNSLYAHYAIRPYSMLDEDTNKYDIEMTEKIPELFAIYKSLKDVE